MKETRIGRRMKRVCNKATTTTARNEAKEKVQRNMSIYILPCLMYTSHPTTREKEGYDEEEREEVNDVNE